MQHLKKLIPLLLIAVVVAALVVARHRRTDEQTRRGNLLRGSGTIEATEVEVAATLGGRLLEVRPTEGETVAKGAMIARLDTRDLEARRVQAEAALAAATANRDRAQNGARDEQLQIARAALDAARRAEEAALAKLTALRNGARPAEKRQAAATVGQAEAAVAGAKLALATAAAEHESVTALKQQVDAAETAHEAAMEQVRLAQARRDLLREGPRREQHERAEAARDRAVAAQINAQQRYDRVRQLFAQGAAPKQALDDAEAALASARAAVAAAEAQVTELKNGARPDELEQAEALLAQAKANAEGTAKALSNAQKAHADRLEARARLEAAQTQLRVAEERRKQAAEAAALVEEGPRAEEVLAAEALHRQAQAQTRAAEAQLNLLLAGEREEVVAAAQAEVARAQGLLQQLDANLADAVIVAPCEGVVAEVVTEPGEVVAPGAALVRLLDLQHAWLKIYLPLTELARVKLGQQAYVVADTFPDKRYPARVVEVSEEAEFTPKNVQTRELRVQQVFWVKLALENPNGELKPGMPAEGFLQLDSQ